MRIRTAWLSGLSFAIALGFGLAGTEFAAAQTPAGPNATSGAGTTPAIQSQPQILAPASETTATAPVQSQAEPPVLPSATTPVTSASPGVLPPPTPVTTAAANAPVSDSALPDGGAVQARSPGMELPPEAGLPSGPTGANGVAGVPPQKSAAEIREEIRDDAFNAALTGLLPLDPPEIRKLLKRFDETKEATETPIFPYPEAESVVKNISLDPGAKPLELKLATGNVTTVSMLDVSGAPWPVQEMTWAGNFTVTPPPAGSHIFVITPMSEFAAGNVSIRMVGLVTPITFILRTHRDSVYYRVDARLPEYGPNAKPPIIDGGITIAAGNTSMTSILDGVAPESAKKLIVDGADGRTTAYKVNSMTYVRTPLTLLSPAWTNSVKSADGMNVYTLDNAPVILLSDQGRMVRARLSDEDDKK